LQFVKDWKVSYSNKGFQFKTVIWGKTMKKLLLFICILFLVGCDAITSEIVDDTKENRKQLGTYISEVVEVVLADNKSSNDVTEDIWEKYNNDFNNPIKKSKNSVIKATVKKIIDGDTIDVILPDGETKRIRFTLIDTPESKGEYKDNPEPYAVEAAEFTNKLLKNQTVWLENDIEKEDKYGRTLAYVWLENVKYQMGNVHYEFNNEITINELLLLHGYAQVVVYKPNVLYVEEFKRTEELAKKNKFGLWNTK